MTISSSIELQLNYIEAELRGPMRLSELLSLVNRARELNTLIPANDKNLSIGTCRICDRLYVSNLVPCAASGY